MIGAGGLGHIGIQCLKALTPAEVIVVDPSEPALELAKQLGADRTDVPPDLESLFRRMLAKQPEDRPQKMNDVVTELEAIVRALAPDEPASLHANLTMDMPSGLEPLGSSGSTIGIGRVPDQTLAIETVAKPITVLVVEPSRVQAAIIKGYLEEQSVPVVGAVANGSDAIQAVRSLRPRAVVSNHT